MPGAEPIPHRLRSSGQDVQEDLSGVGADVTFFLRLRLMATLRRFLPFCNHTWSSTGTGILSGAFIRYQDANGLGAMNASDSREPLVS